MQTVTNSKKVLVGIILMTVATIVYGFIPPTVDLFTTTHVFNPDWVPHARFHTVWLLGTSTSISILALYFLWLHKKERYFAIHLAGILGLCVLGAFMLSVITAPIYGGTLTDPGTMSPVMGGIDTNLFVFSIAIFILLIGWYLASFEGG